MYSLALSMALMPLIVNAQSAASTGHVPGRILVQKVRAASHTTVKQALGKAGAALAREIPELDVFVLSVPEAAMQGMLRKLENTGLFTYAEPDSIGRGGGVPNDPLFGSQWHHTAINSIAAWDISTGSTSVPIAMIDSGVNTHSDFTGKLLPGWSFLLANNNTADVLGHGTATAGTAAAIGNNANGVAGVAWQNPIMPIVILNSSDSATYSDIASAITYAADHGVRIINISIGGSSASSTVQNAVNYAWNKGAVVFASAMNNATSMPYYPAACDHVVAVSATEPGDTLAGFSNFGSWIDLAAPGDNIATTDQGGGYSTWYGTSFSSPIVAGVGALALSINPNLTAQGLVDLLEKNADDIGDPGFDQSFGWGRVNAYKVAIAAAASVSSDSIAPTVSIAAPAAGSVVTGTVQIVGSATDNLSVVAVELWVDGQFSAACSSMTFTCALNTGVITAGNHTLTVKAFDAAGNVGTASVQITVGSTSPTTTVDTVSPTVQVQNPLNNSLVNGNVQVRAAVSDNVGVTQVGFYIDGVLKSSLTAAPWAYTWNTKKSAKGSHTITVKAWDAAGNVGTSSITVRD